MFPYNSPVNNSKRQKKKPIAISSFGGAVATAVALGVLSPVFATPTTDEDTYKETTVVFMKESSTQADSEHDL